MGLVGRCQALARTLDWNHAHVWPPGPIIVALSLTSAALHTISSCIDVNSCIAVLNSFPALLELVALLNPGALFDPDASDYHPAGTFQ